MRGSFLDWLTCLLLGHRYVVCDNPWCDRCGRKMYQREWWEG